MSPATPAAITPASERLPWYTSKPANSIVGSVPGSPITPVATDSSATPASPRSEISCVASRTRGSVSEAKVNSKRAQA